MLTSLRSEAGTGGLDRVHKAMQARHPLEEISLSRDIPAPLKGNVRVRAIPHFAPTPPGLNSLEILLHARSCGTPDNFPEAATVFFLPWCSMPCDGRLHRRVGCGWVGAW